MKSWIELTRQQRFIRLTIILTCLSIGKYSPAFANEFILDDAERFARLFTVTSAIKEEQLKDNYIVPGTKGLEIFTPYRIKNEANLLRAVAENKDAYTKGINVCLPAARSISGQAKKVMHDVKVLLNQKSSAPTYVLFGANNSGGTAGKEGLSIGLEVLCRFAETEKEAQEVILGFVAHEMVHVYQARVVKGYGKNRTLLHQALTEGFADFVANKVLGKVTESESARHDFGIKNEALIWADFKAVMHGKNFRPWMYGKGEKGRPKDLGYWLGKRIAQAYYEKADDKSKAIETLLYLQDPQSILLSSGYDPT